MRYLISRIKRQLKPSKLRLTGKYYSYIDALNYSTGYSNNEILFKVLNATKAVLEGESAYERDGFLFNKRPEKLQIYKTLSALNLNGACILDFGGGLGSLYVNYPDLFGSCSAYYVVEQESFANVGNLLVKEYNLPIRFLDSICRLTKKPTIVILSSVLQYLSDPYNLLLSISELYPDYIILDRTAFGVDNYWSIQENDGVYSNNASYPHRCLSRSTVIDLLKNYSLTKKWTNSFDPQVPLHEGLLFSLR